MYRRRLVGAMVLALGITLAAASVSLASHGPAREGTDACNGTDAFDVNNLLNLEVIDRVAAQNPGARQADGTIDRAAITHALLSASGHVVLQVREKPGSPLERVAFEFTGTNPGWTPDSTNHPGYLTAIDAQENPNADSDSDLVIGRTFTFFIPTDVVSDGEYVARLRGFGPDGSEVGRLCLDALVDNGQGLDGAFSANSDPAYEPSEVGTAEFGFAPQPVVWFPAGEPVEGQQAGYGVKDARIEFAESVQGVTVEREEDLPTPTGVTATASTTGGTLATGTYFYKVTALNDAGETVASEEVSVDVTGPTGQVALSWDAVPRATGYRVYRGATSGGQDVFYAADANSFTDTGAAGNAGSPPSVGTAKQWVDYSSLLTGDDYERPHFLAGGRMDSSPFEEQANEKVWGPGLRFPFDAVPGEALPSERMRVAAQDDSGKRFCGVYTFSGGANGSFLADAPSACN